MKHVRLSHAAQPFLHGKLWIAECSDKHLDIFYEMGCRGRQPLQISGFSHLLTDIKILSYVLRDNSRRFESIASVVRLQYENFQNHLRFLFTNISNCGIMHMRHKFYNQPTLSC